MNNDISKTIEAVNDAHRIVEEVRNYKPTKLDRLREAVEESERAVTNLSNALREIDFRDIPFIEKDLNQSDVGSKIRIGKWLVQVADGLANEV